SPLFSSACLDVHRDLHSFPTRRSSDLAARTQSEIDSPWYSATARSLSHSSCDIRTWIFWSLTFGIPLHPSCTPRVSTWQYSNYSNRLVAGRSLACVHCTHPLTVTATCSLLADNSSPSLPDSVYAP